MGKVYAALVHYPVYNRNGEIITTAVTNLDIHDIARSAVTFGLAGYFIVQPDRQQQSICAEIMAFWQEGYGRKYNPDRAVALDLVRLTADLDGAVDEIIQKEGQMPLLVVTSAKEYGQMIAYHELREKITNDGKVYLLLFGTGWGLSREIMERADHCLPPLKGSGEYNHLAVRSAAAIVFDRLLGE